MTEDTLTDRMDALEDTQATQEEKIDAHGAQLATINKVLPALLQQYARSTGVPLVDRAASHDQCESFRARGTAHSAGEIRRDVARRPVRPHRGKRRELLGK